nr:SMP-30/gluconolactonase/LRE family protein [Kibdelosporangium sp. MJ126-NF4]CEL18121.1 Gluconolactonase [Kibdelosporangium sp. MJ126-NF4]CTQ90650.1 Gluconolactonase (EC 3.1.1.17) [Kibdelosporangium sp. MJ126-NF4]
MTRTLTAELAIDVQAELGEGPAWDNRDGRLLWVDIHQGLFHRYDPLSGDNTTRGLGTPIGGVVPHADGGYVAATGTGFDWLRPDGSIVPLAAVAGDGMRMNDGACAPDGAFWSGSMALDRRPGAGTLYRLGTDGVASPRLTGLTISNGIAFTPDGTCCYFIDTPTMRIDVCALDSPDQSVTSRRPFVRIPEGTGRPDGLALDDEGCVWVAMVRAGRIHRYTPAGVLDTVVTVPVAWTTSCAFGGADGRTLFITTASTLQGVSSPDEGAGGVFAVDAGVSGPAALSYRPDVTR